MKVSSIVTSDDLQPAGMTCPYCKHEFSVGDEQVAVLEAVTDDGIPIALVMCPKCAARSDEIEMCEACEGTGLNPWMEGEVQCDVCGGAGDVLPPVTQDSGGVANE